MNRKEFLINFLGAVATPERIDWLEESSEYISGIVVYDLNDPEEIQEFCWSVSEEQIPSKEAGNLIKLIKEENLFALDKITMNRISLYKKYNAAFKTYLCLKQFEDILSELEMVRIPMIDDGRETDFYFIHE